jgi:ATP-binding cassette subfamily C protein
MLLLPLLTVAGALGGQEMRPKWSVAFEGLLTDVGANARLPAVLVVFVLLVCVQSVLVLLRDRQTHALHLRFTDHLRSTLFSAIAASRWNYLAQRHSGELLSALTADIHRVGVGTLFLLQSVAIGILSAAYLVVALQLSIALTGFALAMGLVLWGLLHKSQGVEKKSGVLLTKVNERIYTQIQEFLGALKLIKIHAEEKASVGEFDRVLAHSLEQQLEFRRTQTSVQMKYHLGGTVALASLTYVALEHVHLPTASLLVLIAIFARMLPRLSQAQGGMSQVWHMLPAYDNWRAQVALCERNRELGLESDLAAPSLNEAITLHKVSYRHGGAGHTLRGEHVSIPARQTTGIFGASGAGKTSLLDLISGLNPPDEGRILVDGVALPPACHAWRRGIAYIPQDTVIMDASVRANLAWGNDYVSEADLWAALEQASASEFVRQLPQGIETAVGERGVRLSGGERQRLALARALLRRPQLLILDEATSALDEANQRVVLEAIRALHGRMTVLVVTHRQEQLAGLIDGRIVVDDGIVSPWESA